MTKYIWAKALWEFEAGEDDELNFFKGDLFKINEADIQRPWFCCILYIFNLIRHVILYKMIIGETPLLMIERPGKYR